MDSVPSVATMAATMVASAEPTLAATAVVATAVAASAMAAVAATAVANAECASLWQSTSDRLPLSVVNSNVASSVEATHHASTTNPAVVIKIRHFGNVFFGQRKCWAAHILGAKQIWRTRSIRA